MNRTPTVLFFIHSCRRLTPEFGLCSHECCSLHAFIRSFDDPSPPHFPSSCGLCFVHCFFFPFIFVSCYGLMIAPILRMREIAGCICLCHDANPRRLWVRSANSFKFAFATLTSHNPPFFSSNLFGIADRQWKAR